MTYQQLVAEGMPSPQAINQVLDGDLMSAVATVAHYGYSMALSRLVEQREQQFRWQYIARRAQQERQQGDDIYRQRLEVEGGYRLRQLPWATAALVVLPPYLDELAGDIEQHGPEPTRQSPWLAEQLLAQDLPEVNTSAALAQLFAQPRYQQPVTPADRAMVEILEMNNALAIAAVLACQRLGPQDLKQRADQLDIFTVAQDPEMEARWDVFQDEFWPSNQGLTLSRFAYAHQFAHTGMLSSAQQTLQEEQALHTASVQWARFVADKVAWAPVHAALD